MLKSIKMLTLSLMTLVCLHGQEQTIGLFQNDSLATNGYTLWTAAQGTYLIDNCGYLINSWEHQSDPGLSVYLLENGNLLRCGRINGSFNGGGTGGLIEEYDWDGNLVWSYQLASTELKQHHDIEPLPNGNILAISWEAKSVEQAQEAGSTYLGTYWPEAIFELEKVGPEDAQVVWEWHVWDHLVQDTDPDKPNYGVVSEHPELMDINFNPPRGGGPGGGGDWLHFNGIDYDPIRDEILISSRHMSEVWIIDHSTTTAEAARHAGGNRGKGGDILYRWGNPNAYGIQKPASLYNQHDVRIIHEGFANAGSITVFNNGTGRPEGDYSTVDMITPPRDADGNYILSADGSYGPDALTWQYVADPPESFFSSNRAGAHRLPNGNTMICEDNAARFFEVTNEGQIVWDYRNTVGRSGPIPQGSTANITTLFRATRYLPDYPAFEGRDLTAGSPVELNPIAYDCTLYDGMVSTDEIEIAELTGITVRNLGEVIEIVNSNKEYLQLHFHSMDGRMLEEIKCPQGRSELNLIGLPSALYVLNIYSEEQNAFTAFKFVKF